MSHESSARAGLGTPPFQAHGISREIQVGAGTGTLVPTVDPGGARVVRLVTMVIASGAVTSCVLDIYDGTTAHQIYSTATFPDDFPNAANQVVVLEGDDSLRYTTVGAGTLHLTASWYDEA